MTTTVVAVLECPQCGAPVQKDSNICNRCFSEYMVRSVSRLKSLDNKMIDKYLNAYNKSLAAAGESAEMHFSIGICYLEKKLYDYAIKSLEKAVMLLPEDSDIYYYAAISLFKGKRPFLSQKSIVDKAIGYLDAALQASQEGRYYYLLYLIQQDFFDMKKLNNRRHSEEYLRLSRQYGILKDDINIISEMLSLPAQ